jgi:hypothetical protein
MLIKARLSWKVEFGILRTDFWILLYHIVRQTFFPAIGIRSYISNDVSLLLHDAASRVPTASRWLGDTDRMIDPARHSMMARAVVRRQDTIAES